jgi:hypothetical protein
MNRIMKRGYYVFFLLGLFVLMPDQMMAQYIFPDQALCQELQQRTLVVQLLDERGEEEKYLNEALKSEFKSWVITPVVFLGGKEVDQLLKNRDTRYAILTQNVELAKDVRSRNVDQNGRLTVATGEKGTFVYKQYYTAFSFSHYNFDLILPDAKKSKTITSVGFANGDLSRVDYVYLVQQLSRLVQASLDGVSLSAFYDPSANVASVRSSKLLLFQDFFKEKELNQIPEYYEAEYELVDMARYQDAILYRSEGVCYVKIIWSDQLAMYEWIVVNASDGKILSQVGFGGVKFGSSHDANELIQVKHLKYVTNEKAQQFNNKYK